MHIGFTKMHGLGNDFVVIDNMNGKIVLSKEQIIFLCDRHKGVGADGVILVESSDQADCFMNYYNSDGTLAEMCGNGVRAVAKFLKDNILPKAPAKTSFKIDTRAGIKNIEYKDDGTFSVNMGKPVFKHSDFPEGNLEIEGIDFNFVSMGNPHAVAFVKDINTYKLEFVGMSVENNKNFPNKINVELVEKKNDKEYLVKVWERGCGATLACGTGACAVYAVYAVLHKNKTHNIEEEVTIHLPGGDLFISQNNEDEIIMRGPAVSVFSAMIELS